MKKIFFILCLVGSIINCVLFAQEREENFETKIKTGVFIEEGISVLRNTQPFSPSIFYDYQLYKKNHYSGIGISASKEISNYFEIKTALFFQRINLYRKEHDIYSNPCCNDKSGGWHDYFVEREHEFTLQHYYMGLEAIPTFKIKGVFIGVGFNISKLLIGHISTKFEEENTIFKNFKNTSILNRNYTYGSMNNIQPYKPGYLFQGQVNIGYAFTIFEKDMEVALSYRQSLNNIGPEYSVNIFNEVNKVDMKSHIASLRVLYKF